MDTYIHYGHKEFNIDKFMPPKSRQWHNKPMGGLWASKVGARFGWKNWCEQNDYDWCDLKQFFKFKISDNAKILYINCVEDVKKTTRSKNRFIFYLS